MFEIDELAERAAKLADRDVTLSSDDELLESIVGVEQACSCLRAFVAHSLAEAERRKLCEERFGHTTKTWLANAAGISARAAGAKVRTARRLRHFPTLDAAVSAGEVSFEHLETLAAEANPRVSEQLGAVEGDMAKLARELRFEAWRSEVRRLVDLLDQDGPEPDETVNRLRFAETLDGVTHLDGTMTGDLAAAICQAVEAEADDLYRRRCRDREVTHELEMPSRDTLRMLALEALVTGRSTGRAEVTLVLHGDRLQDPEGRQVSKAAAGVYGCDPDLWAVLVDRMGMPLDVGHARRFATVAQRRAIAVRDGGCAFPGCDQPMRRCDVHHLHSPLAGGRTAVDAMVALCRRHHTVTHRPGWKIRINSDGGHTWTTPRGEHLTNHRRRQRSRPPPGPSG
jgi:hypothetical protein